MRELKATRELHPGSDRVPSRADHNHRPFRASAAQLPFLSRNMRGVGIARPLGDRRSGWSSRVPLSRPQLAPRPFDSLSIEQVHRSLKKRARVDGEFHRRPGWGADVQECPRTALMLMTPGVPSAPGRRSDRRTDRKARERYSSRHPQWRAIESDRCANRTGYSDPGNPTSE